MGLRWYTKLAFASGHFLNVLGVSMWFPYAVTFYQKVLGIPPKSTGTIILIAQVFGAVLMPFLGLWSDQTHLKYGRRKIFHLVGVCATAVATFFIWHECIYCAAEPPLYQVIYFASFAIVFQFGWAAAQIAQLSLIPELTLDKNVQVGLNALRTAFTIAANIIVFTCFWILLEKVNNTTETSALTPQDKKVFWIMAIVVIVLGVLVSSPFQIVIRENPKAKLPKLRWYKWLLNPLFYLTICAYVTARIVFIVPQTYLPLYLIDTLNMDKASIAKGPLILYIISFITTFVVKAVNKKIGIKMTYFLGMAVVWGAAIWFWVKDASDDTSSHFNWSRDSIYGATILLGIGGATIIVLSLTMISQLVGKYAGSSAFVYGWVMFSDRLSNGVVVKIIQQATPSTSDSVAVAEFYRNVLVFICFAATALGVFTLCALLLLEGVKLLLKKRKIRIKLPARLDQNLLSNQNFKAPLLEAEVVEEIMGWLGSRDLKGIWKRLPPG